MEKIIIKNFAGIDFLEIEIGKFNVFIGKQASGKSITAKLFYFFKSIPKEFMDLALEENTPSQAFKSIIMKFEEYFPSDTWPNKNFEITYRVNDTFIQIKKEKSKTAIVFSERYKRLYLSAKRIIKADKNNFSPEDNFEIYRPNYSLNDKFLSIVQKELGRAPGFHPLFIPAGRSFFANLQSSIFSFLSNNKAMDPFLVEFGSFYENIKPMAMRSGLKIDKKIYELADDIIFEILGSKYHREKNKDFLIHSDKRKINVSFASSGQQETLPLVLILKALIRLNFAGNGCAIFIEEPEAHLFPSAQKKIIELMGLIFNNSRSEIQIIITTHSPYVLTSINNLIQAEISSSESDDAKRLINEIVPKELMIAHKSLKAYTFIKNTAENIVDDETDLIYSKFLDNVSEEIATEFDKLLDI